MTETNYRPTFSVIDVSYGDHVPALPDFITVDYEGRSESNSLRTESEIVTPPSTLVTLPIFVIGFSGTIVLCGLIMLYSEFRARRKFDKDVLMLIQSLSGNSSSAFSSRESFRSSVLSMDQYHSERTISSIYGDIYRGDDICRKGSDKENCDHIVSVCVSDSSDDISPLCYNVHRPENSDFAIAEKAVVVARNGENWSNNHGFDPSADSFVCDQNLHRDREIMFYRSEDSSLSIASTITKSLPLDCWPKNKCSNYDVDSNVQSNESNGCKIMELTEIHRVSTGIALESLVDLGTIPATPIATSSIKLSSSSQCYVTPFDNVAQDEPIVVNLGNNGNEGNWDDIRADEEINNDALSRIAINRHRSSISDFDAGTLPITEAMSKEDFIFNDKGGDIREVGIQEKLVTEDHDEAIGIEDFNDGKSKESSFVVATTATSSISFRSVSSGTIVPKGTSLDSIDSLNTESSDETKSPSPALLLDEGSLVEVAKRNGYSRIENSYRIILAEAESTDGDMASDIVDIFERRGYDECIDFIRSTSSMDASTMTNLNTKEE